MSVAVLAAGALRRDARLSGCAMLAFAAVLISTADSTPRVRSTRADRARIEREAAATALGRVRARAAASIDTIFGQDAPIARALLIADRHQLPPEIRDRYARAGIIHMLSISGLHVGIIAAAALLLLQLARLPPAAAGLLAVFATGVYVAIIGAPPSALRAAAMLGAGAASRILQRPTSPWASLALGAFVPLVQPRTVLNLGYQLSVAGIAGVIASALLAKRLLAPRISGRRLRFGRELLTCVVASFVSAPLIAWHFGRVSIIAPVANMLAGPVIAVLQPTLFLALLLSPVASLSAFIADAAHPLIRFFDGIAAAASGIPGSSIAVVPGVVPAVAAGAAIVALIAGGLSRYPGRPLVLAGVALAVVAWSPELPAARGQTAEMHVLDVGQGDAILFRSDRGRWILFDAGRVWSSGDAGRATIIPHVKRRGGEIVAFVLSHAHADHVGGAATILRSLRPQYFWDAAFVQRSAVYADALTAAGEAGVEWRRVRPGDSLIVDGLRVRFLAPDSTWTASLADPNEASTVALVLYGETRFLLVGDAERSEEEWLLSNAGPDLRADVLKVGHHGSSTSSSSRFLAAVQPRLAVISVGADNSYGHPSSAVIAALSRAGAEIARTDRLGTIIIRTDGQRLTLSAEGGGQQWEIPRAFGPP